MDFVLDRKAFWLDGAEIGCRQFNKHVPCTLLGKLENHQLKLQVRQWIFAPWQNIPFPENFSNIYFLEIPMTLLKKIQLQTLLMAVWFNQLLRLQFTDSRIGTDKNRVALPWPCQMEKKQQNKGLWFTTICNLQGNFN